MERANRIRWKHNGGGILRLRDGRVIKPGEIFFAFPDEISKAFQDTIKPLEQESVSNKPLIVTKISYTPTKRGNSNWWDVIDSKGKVVNEKALKKTEAVELAKKLEG